MPCIRRNHHKTPTQLPYHQWDRIDLGKPNTASEIKHFHENVYIYTCELRLLAGFLVSMLFGVSPGQSYAHSLHAYDIVMTNYHGT